MPTACGNCGHVLPEDGHIDLMLRSGCLICGSTSRHYTMQARTGVYILTGNNVEFTTDGFIGREDDIAYIEGLLLHQQTVAIIGPKGAGKTSLVRRIIETRKYSSWQWVPTGLTGQYMYTDVARSVHEGANARSLGIIDDCDDIDERNLHSRLRNFEEDGIKSVILTAKRLPLIAGREIHVHPIAPWFTALALDAFINGVYFGISENENQALLTTVRPNIVLLNDELIKKLRRYPEDMYCLDPRKLEIVVADLLADQGIHVEITPATRDGGKDIIAKYSTPIGDVLTLVEVKRYRRDRPIRVELVRQLYGVLYDHAASHAMFVTTSSFTRDATEFQQRHKYELSLRDMSDVKTWLDKYKGA